MSVSCHVWRSLKPNQLSDLENAVSRKLASAMHCVIMPVGTRWLAIDASLYNVRPKLTFNYDELAGAENQSRKVRPGELSSISIRAP
jgi:hypothetical protein